MRGALERGVLRSGPMERDDREQTPPTADKVGISGATGVEEGQQDRLPPRGKARQGEGTHGTHRQEPSTKDRPKSNIDTSRV
jgi:hypothetical protein